MSGRDVSRLVFCDLSTFYCERGGGIRTYHRAKIDWFGRQRAHEYVLIHPGRRFRAIRPGPRVTLVEVAGLPTGHGRDGYHLMLDYWRARDVLAAVRPDVIEAGDPWVSGPFALMARHHGHVDALVTSFYHTDSIEAYVRPWLRRSPLPRRWSQRLVDAANQTFWRVQRLYDMTLVASAAMQDRVRSAGLSRVVLTPFGVDARYLAAPPRRATSGLPVRLLYAGRLQTEKSFDIVLASLPHLLDRPDVHLTIVGDGPLAPDVARLAHPQVSHVGFVASREALHDLYRSHDILLATSATETFGIAALEAMACGLVLVGAEAGAIGALVTEARSPFGFRPRDAGSFIRAVRAAIDADRAGPAATARAAAARYGSWDDAIARQVAVYQGLLALRPSARPARAWTDAPGAVPLELPRP